MCHFSLKRCFVCVIVVIAIVTFSRTFASEPPLTRNRPMETAWTPEVVAGTLDNSASRDARRQCLQRTHAVYLVAGRTYAFEMTSGDFETFLMVEDPTGTLVATDGDCPGFRGSRILYRPSMTGEHRLIATSTAPSGRGTYMIAIVPREPGPDIVLDERGFLSLGDSGQDGFHRKCYRLFLTGGRTYTFDLTSTVFNGSLRLERMDGAIAAFDEDGAQGANPRIRFEATEDSVYRIVVTSSAPYGAGPFALRVGAD